MKSGNDGVVVRHREFVQDVPGSVAFAATSLPINAGRDTLFAWLPDIAIRYEKYQFLDLKFKYEPRCSTATAGSVILAVDYDALDSAPTSKQDVYSYNHCSQGAAWDENCMSVEPAILKGRGALYTRVGAAPAVSDLKTYDLGNLFVCTSGFASTDVCGELFVEYVVRLSIPQTGDNTQSISFTGATGMSGNNLVGTATWGAGILDISRTTASTLTLNQKWYGNINIVLTGTGLTAGGFVSSGTAACTLVAGSEIANAAATSMGLTVVCNGLRDQTIILAVTATTVTASSWRFSPLQQ